MTEKTDIRAVRSERVLARGLELKEEKRLRVREFAALRRRAQEDCVPGAAGRLRELREQVKRLEAEEAEAEADVRALIARVPSRRGRLLLEMRYLSGLRWEEIAEQLGISLRVTMRTRARWVRYLDM
ncbi:MAG: hypothetical protein MJ136_04090 [Clostridia bacterium]|nr:hypothetical protein [Clostridia bacterium]